MRTERQRQGRDFFNRFNNNPKDNSEKNRDFLNKIERFKEETERNAVPIDGEEPVTERSL
jgi:hypothetical protein